MKKNALSRLQTYFRSILCLDLRSLALFRVGLSLILLADLFFRALDLRAHYSDIGVAPRWAMLQDPIQEWYFSFHFIGGTAIFQSLMFCISALFAFSLLVGFKTRLSTFLSWLLLVSLQNRNELIVDGGDVALRLSLFWSLFLPLGARFSLDSKGRTSPCENSFSNIASFAFIYQLLCIYFFTSLLKTHSSWNETYTAVYYAFSLDLFSTDLAEYLLNFPELMSWLTFIGINLERYGFILLLVPFYNPFFRTVCVFLFMGFHLGLALSLELGIFAPFMCIFWSALLPSAFWEYLTRIPVIKKFCLDSQNEAEDETISLRALERVIVVTALVYITMWNVRSLDIIKYQKYFSRSHNWIADLTRIDQYWSMFAPAPMRDDGWYVIPGTTYGGQTVDLWNDPNGEKISIDKPSESKPIDVSTSYRNQRWRKYLMNIWLKKNSAHRERFAAYLCHTWNEQHSGNDLLEKLKIYFMLERTTSPGKGVKVKRHLLWTHSCFGVRPNPIYSNKVTR